MKMVLFMGPFRVGSIVAHSGYHITLACFYHVILAVDINCHSLLSRKELDSSYSGDDQPGVMKRCP
jgi:hypothetical protein